MSAGAAANFLLWASYNSNSLARSQLLYKVLRHSKPTIVENILLIEFYTREMFLGYSSILKLQKLQHSQQYFVAGAVVVAFTRARPKHSNGQPCFRSDAITSPFLISAVCVVFLWWIVTFHLQQTLRCTDIRNMMDDEKKRDKETKNNVGIDIFAQIWRYFFFPVILWA